MNHIQLSPGSVTAVLVTTAVALALVATTALPAGATSPEGDSAREGRENKVVLFAIDGFDADYLDGRAPLPHLRALAPAEP